MDIMSHGNEQTPVVPNQTPARKSRRKHFDWDAKVVRIEWFIFTFLVALVLLISIGWSIWSNGSIGYQEANQVNSKRYQAVFLNGSQASTGSVASIYFGHIVKLTENYLVLRNVYFLTAPATPSNQTSQSSNLQLTKLGCQQLHSPYDEMVVNRSQVTFWENLQDSGKVAQAIKQFIQKFPNGPNCSATSTDTSGSNSQNSSSSTNGQ